MGSIPPAGTIRFSVLSMKLEQIAQVVRSKNAGPRCLTLDVMFAAEADFERVVRSGTLTRETISRLYEVPIQTISILEYPLARAIKIVIPRKITSGDPGDRDVYGAQQHAPLLNIEI